MNSVIDILYKNSAKVPAATAFAERIHDNETWHLLSWRELAEEVKLAAAGFLASGLSQGDRVGILMPVCVAWEKAHLAVLAASGVVVGLDCYDTPSRLEGIINQAGVSILVVKDSSWLDRLTDAALNSLSMIVCFDSEKTGESKISRSVLLWRDLVSLSCSELPRLRGHAPATLVYTSGSTGEPKGVLYTHSQLMLAVETLAKNFSLLAPGSRIICWLPLSNLFQRVVNLVAIRLEAQVFFVANPRRIIEELLAVRPQAFVAVPRFYEKFAKGVREQIAQRSSFMQFLFRSAISSGRRRYLNGHDKLSRNFLVGFCDYVLDYLILRKIRQKMGGEIRFLLSGSSPLSFSVLEFFHCLGLPLLEAYGLTECIVPVAINRMDDFRLGSVGRPLLPGSVKISEEGEVLVKNAGVFSGYYSEIEESRDRFSADGFLLTGDLGQFDGDGFLYLSGRSGDIIKTSTGRRLSPEKIEADFREVDYLEQIAVFGHGLNQLVGLVTIDWQAAQRAQELSSLRSLRELIARDLKRSSARLAHYEQPIGYLVLSRSFSVEGGELTPNLKLRRSHIGKKYEKLIGELYVRAMSAKEEGAVVWFLGDDDNRGEV